MYTIKNTDLCFINNWETNIDQLLSSLFTVYCKEESSCNNRGVCDPDGKCVCQDNFAELDCSGK